MNAKSTSTLAASAILALAFFSNPTPARAEILSVERPISGRYIVVLKDGVVRTANDARSFAPTLEELSGDLTRLHGGQAEKRYAAALSGFSFAGSAAAAEALARDPRVAYVSEDGLVELASAQTPVPSWGLDRIDQRDSALDDTYTYETDGTGIDVYIIDTGIRSTHNDFGARVDTANAFTTIDDGWGTEDCHGHGTHVAGVVGGSTYGVAKGVTLHPVRVVNCSGFGSSSDIIAGVDWIAARHPAGSPTRAVVNLSLRCDYTYALDQAVLSSIAAGITYVVAAGNDNGNACYLSPGGLPGVITVGASNSTSARWASSNFGGCVDLFAPGTLIQSSFNRSDDDTIPMTGTSASSPHVAGTAALLLAGNPNLTPQDVQTMIVAEATADALSDVGAGSPNLLLFSTIAGPEDLPPVAAYGFTCHHGNCGFDASGSADDWGILSYDWNFGDGSSAAGVAATHRFRHRGGPGRDLIFQVTLMVTDTSGQTTSLVQAVSPFN